MDEFPIYDILSNYGTSAKCKTNFAKKGTIYSP